MTLSTGKESLFQPSDMSDADFNRSDLSMSEDGTWVVMGTPAHGLDEDGLNFIDESGACYIYKKDGDSYTQKQKLVDSGRIAGNDFGSRVWMSSYGRRLFVASKNDSNTISNGGSVSVYDLDETNDIWNFKLKIEIATPLSGAKFGWSIMSDYYGHSLVVGSPFEDNGGTLRGAGYLFVDNGTTFAQLNRFSYSKNLDYSRLGYSVAISGDGNIIFMGMPLVDLSGSVGVFKKNIAGTFPSIETSIIRDSDGLADDYFSIALGELTELVPDGDMSSIDGWTGFNSTLSRVNGVLRVIHSSDGQAYVYRTIVTVVGYIYLVTVDYVTDNVTGVSRIFIETSLGGGGDNYRYEIGGIINTYTFKFKATVALTYIRLGSSTSALSGEYNEWDNVSIKITNDLISNGTFQDSTGKGWTITGTGWVIGGGVLSGSNPTGLTRRTLPIIIGRKYLVIYDVVTVSSGSFFWKLGGVSLISRGSIGTYPEIITAVTTEDLISQVSSFTGSIDNVSVTPVVEDIKDKSAGNSLVVDHEGRNLYIGAHNKLDSDSGVRGAVFRYTGDTDYNYTIRDIILQRKGRTLDVNTLLAKFGFYIAIDRLGKVLVVGAKDDGEIISGSGAIYVYKRDLSLNTYTLKIKQDTPVADDHNGNSVAISNDASTFMSVASKS